MTLSILFVANQQDSEIIDTLEEVSSGSGWLFTKVFGLAELEQIMPTVSDFDLILLNHELGWHPVSALLARIKAAASKSGLAMYNMGVGTPTSIEKMQVNSGEILHLYGLSLEETMTAIERLHQHHTSQPVLTGQQRRQSTLLDVIAFTSAQLTLKDGLVAILERVFPYMGHLCGADTVYIFQNHKTPDADMMHMSTVYQWYIKRSSPIIELSPPRWQNVSYEGYHVEPALDQLRQGDVVYGRSSSFDQSIQRFLEDVLNTDFIALAPIFCFGEWWGALALEIWKPEYVWDTADAQAFQAVANMLGSVIQNDSLLEERSAQLVQANQISTLLHRQTDELAGLYEISTSITGVLEPHELIERLYVQIMNLMNPDMVIGVLYDDQAEEVEVVVAQEFGRQLGTLPVGIRVPVADSGITGWMIRNKKPVFLPDYQKVQGPVPIKQVAGTPRSWLGAPLMIQGQVIGAISVQSYQPDVFDRGDIRFVEAVATQAAVAINSARIYQKERQYRQISGRLHRLTAQLNSSLEIQPIMDQALETVRAILPDMSICVISFYDPQGDTLTTQAVWADQEQYIFTPVGQSVQLSQTQIAQQAIRHQKMIVIEDMAQIVPKNERAAKIQEDGIGALLYIPIVLEGRPIGLLSINFWNRARQFAAEEISLCEAATNHVVMALKNARIFESEIKRRREAELLQQLSSYLIDAEGIKQVFIRAVGLLKTYLLDVSFIRFLSLDATGNYLLPIKGWRDESLPIPTFTEGDQIPLQSTFYARKCFEEKRPVIVDYEELKQTRSFSLRRRVTLGLEELFYIPLLLKDKAVGMLQIETWHGSRPFKQEEIALCQAFCNQVATAIEKVKLMEAEREQLQLAQTLRDMGALLTSDLTLDRVFERIFDLLGAVMMYDTVSIQLYEANYGQMRLAAGRGFKNFERTAAVVKDVGPHELSLLGTKPFRVTKDTLEDPDWKHVEDYEPIRASMSCALRVKGRLVGILSVDSFTPYAYDETMAEKAIAFANQAVIAIENARLYDQVNQRAQELSVLNQIAITAATVQTVDDLLAQTTEIVIAHMYRDHFGFLLLDDSKQYLVPHPSYHIKQKPKLPYRVAVNRTLTGFVAQTQRPYWGNVSEDEIPRYYKIDVTTGSELAVPLMVNNQVFAVINVEKTEPNGFAERDLSFVQGLADQLSVAIQRVQLYEDSQFYAAQLVDKVEQRTAELQSQRDRMEMILDNVGEGVIFADAETNILYANPALLAQSGYVESELTGRPARVLNSPLHNDQDTYTEMRQVLRKHGAWTGELVNMRKDGSFYEILLNINAIFDANRKLIGFVSIQADITHLKEIERLKSEFVSNVSHELRTPLTNIKTYLTLLRRGREEKRERYQNVLEQEADRLARLIQDLLDLSRLDSNSVKTNLAPLELLPLIQECVESFRAKINGRKQHIVVIEKDGLPQVLADRDQLMQVLNNLVGNATDYTPDGGALKIYVDVVMKDGVTMAGFLVEDTGPGIPPQELSKLFERFFRGEVARNSQKPGTGLGLAISKEIIERHNGLIEVESQPDVGTTFKVWLPVVKPG